jgi:MarR family transcriptional regulator for hemolysin
MKMQKSPALLREFTADLILSGRLWRKMTRDLSARYGIAEAGAGPLIWIGRLGENVRQNALAERCGIEGASLVRILDDLQKAGFVTRTPDPADRRANLLQLTDAGRQVLGGIETDLADMRAAALADISADDIEAAMRVFAALKLAAGHAAPRSLESVA